MANTVVLLVLSVLLVSGVVLTGCVVGNRIGISLTEGAEELVEKEILPAEKRRTDEKVLLVDISGIMSMQSSPGFLEGYKPNMVEELRSVFQKAREDDDIKAVLLRINSPGGEMTSIDIIYREIMTFKEEQEVPIVASMMQVAASGGYYAACTADHVMAHPTTLTGSIGTILNLFSIAELMDKIGVEYNAVTSGEMKDMGSLFKPMSAEERELLQKIIDQEQERFIEVVDKGRPELDRDRVRVLADGRIYSAYSAEEYGLVDELGYLEDAFAKAKELAGVEDAALVMYTYYPERPSNIYSPSASAHSPGLGGDGRKLASWLRSLADQQQAPLWSLWVPGLFLDVQ